MNKIQSLTIILFCLLILSSCKKDDKKEEATKPEPKLIVKVSVDPTQERLGNAGTPVSVPAGHAAQDPVFNKIAAHYLELAPNANTALGTGAILYHAPETTTGGANAIDFEKSIVKAPGETYLEIPLKNIPAGSYEWVRLSVSYQNYDVAFTYNNQPFSGTVASFVGFNTYVKDYLIKTQTVTVNANKAQGYWGFETIGIVTNGQAPAGATTVPNPLFATSPIPQGSCVVTGKFTNNLVITGNETQDIIVNLSLSTNHSFEWEDTNGDGKWNVTQDSTERVVDMGLRGLIPKIE